MKRADVVRRRRRRAARGGFVPPEESAVVRGKVAALLAAFLRRRRLRDRKRTHPQHRVEIERLDRPLERGRSCGRSLGR